MRNWLNISTALAATVLLVLMLSVVTGCDDPSAKHPVKAARMAEPAAPQPGLGWQETARNRNSAWGTAGSNVDAVSSIEVALDAGTLPPRDTVHVAALVNRVLADTPAADPATRPVVMLTTSPWNDDTLLLWVAVSSPPGTPQAAIRIAFEPASVSSYRAMGDPAALAPAGRAARSFGMLYEIVPQPGAILSATTRYAELSVGSSEDGSGGQDRPITGADVVDSLDDAPDTVRFAVAVAGFGGLLRGDAALRDLSCEDVIAMAESADKPDPSGLRAKLIALMKRAEPLIDVPSGDAPQGSR
jgi:hypothetical protein